MRGIFIIGFGIFLDLLQGGLALFFVALQLVTPVGGGIGAAGFCYAVSSSVVSGIVNALTCAAIGTGASAYAVPIGGAVDMVLSFTFGAALIALLAFSGMFYPGIVVGSFIGESIPLFDAIFPGWTLMAWRCVRNKSREEAVRSKASRAEARDQIIGTQQQTWQDIRGGNYTGERTSDYAEAAA